MKILMNINQASKEIFGSSHVTPVDVYTLVSVCVNTNGCSYNL